MKNQTDQNTQQPKTLVAQENKLFVPEDHPLRERLIALFNHPDFQFIKAGLDHYEVPYLYDPNENDLLFGAENDSCSRSCDFVMDTVSYGYHIFHNILPAAHYELLNKVNSSTVPEMNHAFSAYQRLHTASIAYDDANGITTNGNPAEIWEYFDDLVNLAFYIFRNDEVKLDSVGHDGLTFCFEYQSPEAKATPFPICIEFNIKSKGDIFNALDRLRAHYLLCHYLVTWDTDTITQIIKDYHQIASRYVCHLNFTTVNSPIALFSLRKDNMVIYHNAYQTQQSDGEYNLHALIEHIRRCPRKRDVENADEIIAKFTEKAPSISPNSAITLRAFLDD